MNCAQARPELGAYLLGLDDPGVDREELIAHLRTCADCRADHDELSPLPAMLALVSEEDISGARAPAPPGLLDRVLDSVAAERRSRRRRYLGTAAAVVVLTGAGVGAVTWWEGSRPDGQPPLATVAASNPTTGVRAMITLEPKNWGTALTMQLRGVAAEQRCSLVVFSSAGDHDTAASWRIGYRGRANVNGATSFYSDEIASVAVVSTTGATLVTIPVSGGE